MWQTRLRARLKIVGIIGLQIKAGFRKLYVDIKTTMFSTGGGHRTSRRYL
jgi:hypothetical protein